MAAGGCHSGSAIARTCSNHAASSLQASLSAWAGSPISRDSRVHHVASAMLRANSLRSEPEPTEARAQALMSSAIAAVQAILMKSSSDHPGEELRTRPRCGLPGSPAGRPKASSRPISSLGYHSAGPEQSAMASTPASVMISAPNRASSPSSRLTESCSLCTVRVKPVSEQHPEDCSKVFFGFFGRHETKSFLVSRSGRCSKS